jgi:hypothetical protein
MIVVGRALEHAFNASMREQLWRGRMSKEVVFVFEIVLDESYCNDAAKQFIPELIKDFARQVVIKSSLLATPNALTMRASIASHPDYLEKPLDLNTEPTAE